MPTIKQLGASNLMIMITRIKDFIYRKISVFITLFIDGVQLGNNDKISDILPEVFLEKILKPKWETTIMPSLIAKFGLVETLYVIFYLGKNQDEIIMEIWDHNYFDAKPSQVFVFELDAETVLELKSVLKLTENRSQAKKYALNNWN
ncbi:MAG: hypothetical protein EAZ78_15475 [Oscillatoriales cyanobacterium]|uniref:Uncharacterized protein n=1 Tax=Microcoleus anatoxicus PTRS2 TaxID=2705321 RepID=A0ABU8YU32_9CYAN|nr:MAG: hypothetical protein EAZ96_22500 [Oscillatoriales cyanobacterium]TAF02239.1 MAG: hypothetical protein EAZ78_15475 [Oscillatoriales cyanobacterium]TAF34151.1 MAG: hypothetical protein EAZ68_19385 [Oscillatoriales cyanobacterium]TAF71677.1 MAG: hypothetical protein EAZ59_00140 [Oscillatoriales cyanobacterium]